jgi:hypothetical protein
MIADVSAAHGTRHGHAPKRVWHMYGTASAQGGALVVPSRTPTNVSNIPGYVPRAQSSHARIPFASRQS